MGPLDFGALEAIAARGYESSRDAVERWWTSFRPTRSEAQPSEVHELGCASWPSRAPTSIA
jgi:hypothetical protein